MSDPPLKKALRILFTFNLHERLNLFEIFPWLRHFFSHRRNLFLVRSAGDIVFGGIILSGLFGPQDPQRNVALFLAWGIWWTSVVLSWFFVGKLWCGFCPFPGIGRILQKTGIGSPRPVPPWLRKHGPTLSLILLGMIIWAEAVTGMRSSPSATALLLLSILLGATVFGALYQGQSWCRFLCPMGKIIGSAATISMIEFRPDAMQCRKCTTFACRKGKEGKLGCPVYLGAFNVRDSVDCLVCGRCVSTCDQDSPRLNLRNPFSEMLLNRGRSLAYRYIIPFLMGSQLARFAQGKEWYESLTLQFGLSSAAAFTVVLALGYAFFWLLIRAGSLLLPCNTRVGQVSTMAAVFIPIGFTGELMYRLEYFLQDAGSFLPTWGRQFGFDLESWGFSVSTSHIQLVCLAVLALGTISSCTTAFLLNRAEFHGTLPMRRSFMLALMSAAVFAIYVFFFIATPVPHPFS